MLLIFWLASPPILSSSPLLTEVFPPPPYQSPRAFAYTVVASSVVVYAAVVVGLVVVAFVASTTVVDFVVAGFVLFVLSILAAVCFCAGAAVRVVFPSPGVVAVVVGPPAGEDCLSYFVVSSPPLFTHTPIGGLAGVFRVFHYYVFVVHAFEMRPEATLHHHEHIFSGASRRWRSL